MIQEDVNYKRIEEAIKFLTENYKQQPSLYYVADEVNVSPFHFQKMFTEWAGISPKKFLQYLTIEEAKKINEQNGNEKAKFLESIKGMPVKWWNNNKQGEIVQNGIKFSFTISETCISTKTEICYQVPNTLESFLKLADNKY